MEIMKLIPTGKDYLWGGTRLREEYGKKIDLTPLAETWECSVYPDGPSYVANGTYKEKTLADVLKAHPEYLGTKVDNGELPVLVKFIDAKKDLSVQVHPSDDYARGIDYTSVAKKRQDNFVFLDVQFGNMNELKLKSVYGAFMYPLLIQNGAAVRKELQKERIYIPTLWPNVLEECPSNSLEYHYAADILPIPVDQRYEIEDMKYLVEVIKVVSSERT